MHFCNSLSLERGKVISISTLSVKYQLDEYTIINPFSGHTIKLGTLSIEDDDDDDKQYLERTGSRTSFTAGKLWTTTRGIIVLVKSN